MNQKLTNKNFKITYTISNKMVNLISAISNEITKLSVTNNLSNYPRLKKHNRIKSIHSSLSIENNTLSFEQVKDVINDKKVLGSQLDIIAVQNANNAYDMLDDIEYDNIDHLLMAHSVMMSRLIDENGKFRSGNVFIGDKTPTGYKIVYKAPDPIEVPGLINQLFYWLKNDDSNLIIKSCVVHYYLACIHPFKDGNGRTSRLWQTAILMNENILFKWIPVESFIFNKRKQYYDILKESNLNYDCSIFIEFILQAILDSIKSVLKETNLKNSTLSNNVIHMLEIMNSSQWTAKDLMNKLRLKSKSGFIKNYLKPALDAGVISMTNPSMPTSKNQKYYKK